MKALHINGNDLALEAVREVAVEHRAVLLDPEKNYTNDQFDGEVSKLREFTQQRVGFVTQEVNASR